MIKNLVFDFGGVIVDLDKDNAIRQFKEIGVHNIEDYIGLYAQQGIFLEVEDGTIDEVTFCRNLSMLIDKELAFEEVKNAWLAFIAGLDESKLDYIESLKNKYNLYILSNTNPFIQSWAQSSDFSSKERPLNDYFKKIYASYEMGYIKPNRKIFELMVEDAHLIPSETLFIDDGESNITIAKEMGFKTYLAKNKEDWRDSISKILELNK
ncbi:MAG: HAD family phosphatase [Bacteroides sp.]|nr:HAD family phosphatase [Bacteroides sp.]MDD4721044.1 HAD family phosphatase [Bacteroides sp.]NLI64647.1 HAD family phosphatase [Bacteroidales bacterium]